MREEEGTDSYSHFTSSAGAHGLIETKDALIGLLLIWDLLSPVCDVRHHLHTHIQGCNVELQWVEQKKKNLKVLRLNVLFIHQARAWKSPHVCRQDTVQKKKKKSKCVLHFTACASYASGCQSMSQSHQRQSTDGCWITQIQLKIKGLDWWWWHKNVSIHDDKPHTAPLLVCV